MNKNRKDIIELSIPSTLGYEKVAMATAAAMARAMGFSKDRIDDLNTAVCEACLNAIEHGNKQDASIPVMVTLTNKAAGLEVKVADSGQGITQKTKTPQIERKIAEQEEARGWGIFLIEQLVDEVTFEKRPQGGNLTRLCIYLK